MVTRRLRRSEDSISSQRRRAEPYKISPGGVKPPGPSVCYDRSMNEYEADWKRKLALMTDADLEKWIRHYGGDPEKRSGGGGRLGNELARRRAEAKRC